MRIPKLAMLEVRTQSHCLLHAQRSRESNFANLLYPPKRQVSTIFFASKVLKLPALSKGTRSHDEKLRYERRKTVECKEARIESARQHPLTCTLRLPELMTTEENYDHVFRTSLHPLLL